MIRCETCLVALQIADREDNISPDCKDYKILEHFDDDVCDLFNKYLGVGFVSENNNQFFDDEDLVADFNYHIEGLKTLIQYTREVK